MAHCRPDSGACRSRPMAGTAMFTIVLSSPTMSRLMQQMARMSRRRRRVGASAGAATCRTIIIMVLQVSPPRPGMRHRSRGCAARRAAVGHGAAVGPAEAGVGDGAGRDGVAVDHADDGHRVAGPHVDYRAGAV